MYKFLIYVKRLSKETGILYIYLLLDGKIVYNNELYCEIERRLVWISDNKKAYNDVVLIPCPNFLYYNKWIKKRFVPTYFEICFENLNLDECYLQ